MTGWMRHSGFELGRRAALVAVALAVFAAGPASAQTSSPVPAVTAASFPEEYTLDLAGTIQAPVGSCGAPAAGLGCPAYFQLQGPNGPIAGHVLFWTDSQGQGTVPVSDDLFLPNTGAKIGATYTPYLVVANSAGSVVTSAAGPPIVYAPGLSLAPPRIAVSGVPRGCVSKNFRVHVAVADSVRVIGAQAYLDRRPLASSAHRSFSLLVSLGRTSPGQHRLRLVASDAAHQRFQRTFTFRVCGSAGGS